ncbi:DUF5626 family protein [Dellaglioa sp. BT-FLS60]
MKRIVVSILGILFLVMVTSQTVSASDTNNAMGSYDLSVGGTKTYSDVDSNGEQVELSIQEDLDFTQLANKTYTITKKGYGWRVSYKIKVSGNKIMSATNLKAVATLGSFKSESLRQLSSKKVQWKATHSWGIFTRNISCSSIIKGGKLTIS